MKRRTGGFDHAGGARIDVHTAGLPALTMGAKAVDLLGRACFRQLSVQAAGLPQRKRTTTTPSAAENAMGLSNKGP